jgi:hypothetical protein
MRAELRCALVVVMALIATAALFANPVVWPPDKVPAPPSYNATVSLTIQADFRTRTTVINLPAGTLKKMQAQLPPKDEGSRFAALPAGNTIVAALALSAGVVLAGLWLARGGRRRALTGFVCLFAAVAVVGVSCLPRHKDQPQPPPELPPPVVDDGRLVGTCRLATSQGEEVRVAINRRALEKLAEQASRAEESNPGAPLNP